MAKIDSQMQQIYRNCTQGSSDQGAKVSEREAKQLIRRAEEINSTSSSSFHSKTRKGNKYLLRLIKDHKSDFSQESKRMIQRYIQTGQIPSSSGLLQSYKNISQNDPIISARVSETNGTSAYSGTGDNDSIRPNNSNESMRNSHNSVRRDTHEVNLGVPSNNTGRHVRFENGEGENENRGPRNHHESSSSRTSNSYSRSRSSGHGIDINNDSISNDPTDVVPNSHSGDRAGENRVNGNNNTVSGHSNGRAPNSIQPTPGNGSIDAPGGTNPINDTIGEIGSFGKVILNFVANKKTWRCHWFPFQEIRPNGGDPVNNLYAKNGALDKLDMVTGGKSREYEFTHNRKAIDEGPQYSWWGHCNNAAEAACLLQAPKHGVIMKGKDQTDVEFTKGDIQGLLVKVTPSLTNKVDFKGERCNDLTRDDPNDPKPALFLEVMQTWAKDGLPFVLDIDRGPQVWNFPYDQVKIQESDKPPAGFDASELHSDGSVKYYHVEMSGTGFEDKRRVYECWLAHDSSGAVIDSGWIKTPNTHNNPDFMWQPHPIGDLMDKSTWQLRGNINNPEVDPQVIYEIYMKSLT
jgi:hypothetical protein